MGKKMKENFDSKCEENEKIWTKKLKIELENQKQLKENHAEILQSNKKSCQKMKNEFLEQIHTLSDSKEKFTNKALELEKELKKLKIKLNKQEENRAIFMKQNQHTQ